MCEDKVYTYLKKDIIFTSESFYTWNNLSEYHFNILWEISHKNNYVTHHIDAFFSCFPQFLLFWLSGKLYVMDLKMNLWIVKFYFFIKK